MTLAIDEARNLLDHRVSAHHAVVADGRADGELGMGVAESVM